MTSRELSNLMWGEALSLLEQADRLHRQFCRPDAGRVNVWEPPIDVIETDETLIVQVALPGASADSVLIELQPGAIAVSARRAFALDASQRARVHALEIPYGRFARRIVLPVQALTLVEKKLQDGCLTLTFRRKETP